MQNIVIYFIKLYKSFISPILPQTCRFYPSCSTYSIQSIEKYGLIRGGVRSFLRILRCNPFHPGGYDPVE